MYSVESQLEVIRLKASKAARLNTFFKKVYAVFEKKGSLGTLRYVSHWVFEKYHERRLGIETAGYVGSTKLGLDVYQGAYREYEPVTYASLFRALSAVAIRPGQDVFLDYGSGKGRAVIGAATYPLKRSIGVEITEYLHKAAKENLRRARKKLRCRDVELIKADAIYYEPPDDASIVFLYNTFSLELMHAVIEKLCASVKRVPRSFTILMKYPSWSTDPLTGDKRFAMMCEQRSYSESGEVLRIYRHRGA